MVATALKNWLPDILQFIETWTSEHDIDAGVRWSQKLSSILEDSMVGILIVTPENQSSSWLIFEAGALSKSVENSKVIPLLIDLKPSNVLSPLSQFQSVESTKAGMKKLLASINKSSPNPIGNERLDRLVERMWEDLNRELQKAISHTSEENKTNGRSEREILNEILSVVRSNFREVQSVKFMDTQKYTNFYIEIDTTPLFPENGKIFSWKLPNGIDVSEFLDEIYSFLNECEYMEAYQYGVKWVLTNTRTKEIFDQIGIDYCQSSGRVRDYTKIKELDIRNGDRLLVNSPNKT